MPNIHRSFKIFVCDTTLPCHIVSFCRCSFVPMMSGYNPESGFGSEVLMTETANHLVRADFILIQTLLTFIGLWVEKLLFWTPQLQSRTKSKLSDRWYFLSALLLCPVRACTEFSQKVPPKTLRYSFFYHAVTCSYMCMYCCWSLKQVFSAWNASKSYTFCFSQVNLLRTPCVRFTDVLLWSWWCLFFLLLVFLKMYCFQVHF